MLLCRIATAVIILVGLLLQTPAMAQNLAAATPAKKPPPGAGVPAFDTDILPILREKCLWICGRLPPCCAGASPGQE